MNTIKAWWKKPAQGWQIWLPQSGPGFWASSAFAVGFAVAKAL